MKPHIWYMRHYWYCQSDDGTLGRGKTTRIAFVNWLRADFYRPV